MQNWEATHVHADNIHSVDRHIEAKLKDGWDVVSVVPAPEAKGQFYVFFKRLKQS
jgi:hypothetical protein